MKQQEMNLHKKEEDTTTNPTKGVGHVRAQDRNRTNDGLEAPQAEKETCEGSGIRIGMRLEFMRC